MSVVRRLVLSISELIAGSPMKKLRLEVGADHVEDIAKKGRKPLDSVEELIWNSLDADATEVDVSFDTNELGGLSKIEVADNGTGIDYELCELAFGKLGSSPKRNNPTTAGGRITHGKLGEGRFRAFGLGQNVKWESTYLDHGQAKRFTIEVERAALLDSDVSEVETLRTKKTGVKVVITGIDQALPSLLKTEKATLELSRRFALYLRAYAGIRITYDGQFVDPAAHQLASTTYPLVVATGDGGTSTAQLTVIEWKEPMDRVLYLCDANGFALDERSPGIQAPGFNFSAYLSSSLVPPLVESGAIALDSLHPIVASLVDAAKDQLRDHFRAREAERTKDLVQRWKDENVYPFSNSSTDPVSQAEREVFDVCAAKVNDYLPGFEKSEAKSKRLTFRLIKEALEGSPENLGTILRQVLELPAEQQAELATILGRTKLTAVIAATKTVISRQDFLASLDTMLFGTLKKALLERKQLHRILARELWVFGEEYSLGNDDESLKAVLEKHIQILGRKKLDSDMGKVTDTDGKDRIVDLMLYKKIPQRTKGQFEHLVIELKRPSVKLGQKEYTQIQQYAISVANDERFSKGNTRWTFMLIGNDLTPFVEQMCHVQNREYGNVWTAADGSVNIHVKKWASIIADVKWRYEFFREHLQLEVTTAHGIDYLKDQHSTCLPKNKL